MPTEHNPAPEVVGVILVVTVVALIAILGLVCLIMWIKDYYEAQEQQARRNEKYTVRSRIVFSNQKNSEQPVVIINTHAVPVFKFFDNVQERNNWKRWVKKCYEEQNGSFPVYINGVLRR